MLLFDTDGLFLDGKIVHQSNFLNINPQLPYFGTISHPDNLSFFFVGSSPGFQTKYREFGRLTSDSFIYLVDCELGSDCTSSSEIS